MFWLGFVLAKLEQVAGIAFGIANVAYCILSGLWLFIPLAAAMGSLFASRTLLTRIMFTTMVFLEATVAFFICDATNDPGNVYNHFVHENIAPVFWYGLLSSICLWVAWIYIRYEDALTIQSH